MFCTSCSADFNKEDFNLLNKFDVNEPAYCSVCRHIYRAAFRPGNYFFKRKSSYSGKDLISIYPENCGFPIYNTDEWENNYDHLNYGRNFDFSKTFFEQFKALHSSVPRHAIDTINCENSDYAFHAGNSKNIYFSNTVFSSSNAFYSETVTNGSDQICDSLRTFKSSYLYNAINCWQTNYSAFVQECHNSRDCFFSFDLKGCHDCIFCWNLRNQKYCIFNEQLTKEEFLKRKALTLNGDLDTHTENLITWQSVIDRSKCQAVQQTSSEDCYGHSLLNCKNAYDCYHSVNLVDSRYMIHVGAGSTVSSCMDCTVSGIGELIYNSVCCGGGNYFLRMCAFCRYSNHLTYCMNCEHSKNCFGSIGIKRGENIILNKSYSQHDYEQLTKKITSHMKESGEWGQFFPSNFSSFNYNQSMASLLNPLDKLSIENLGFKFLETRENLSNSIKSFPANISELSEAELKNEYKCSVSGAPFKIIKQELEFLKLFGLGFPVKAPVVRMRERFQRLSKINLSASKCSDCGLKIDSYYTDRKVVCNSCFEKAIH